ncbi:hypothetical protein [Sulfuriflexus mobilis]|uniref:hypothetical protein n=1 Tax=Sulfuriflexus mobilis TaxID=1811807 RepID=UPI000F820988|nr:hypothetical protein [Sulfuriflexus mobilis]
MKKHIIPTIAFALFTTSAYGQSMQVGFSNVTTVVPGGDIKICKARYGTGYVTSPHKNGAKIHKSSDKGHFIHITKSNVTLHHDVYVMANEYNMSYPGDKGEITAKAYVYATALDRKSGFSGVFSDGQCKGQLTISAK